MLHPFTSFWRRRGAIFTACPNVRPVAMFVATYVVSGLAAAVVWVAGLAAGLVVGLPSVVQAQNAALERAQEEATATRPAVDTAGGTGGGAAVDTTGGTTIAIGGSPAAASENGVSRVRRSGSGLTEIVENIRYGFFNFTSIPMQQANQGSGRFEAYNYLTADYRLSPTRRISLRPVFHWSTGGENLRGEFQAGDVRLGDAYLNYSDSGLVDLPYDIDFKSQLRVYAPTSETSQQSGMIVRLRPWFTATRRITRDFDLSLHFEPDYYFQRRTASYDRSGRIVGNRHYGYESSIELQYRISRRFGLGTGIGLDESWSHASPANYEENVFGRDRLGDAYRNQSANFDLSTSASVGPLFVVLGVSQKRDLIRPRVKEFSLLRESESQYYLLSSYRF